MPRARINPERPLTPAERAARYRASRKAAGSIHRAADDATAALRDLWSAVLCSELPMETTAELRDQISAAQSLVMSVPYEMLRLEQAARKVTQS